VSVALCIHHAQRMRRIVLPSVIFPAVPYFSTLSQKKGTNFGKKKLFYIKCVFWFSLRLLSHTFLVARRIRSDVVRSMHRSVFMWSAGWHILVAF